MLTIAIVKALFVILYFMHVRWSTRLTWVVAASGFFWLLIMFAFTMTRLPEPRLAAGDAPMSVTCYVHVVRCDGSIDGGRARARVHVRIVHLARRRLRIVPQPIARARCTLALLTPVAVRR